MLAIHGGTPGAQSNAFVGTQEEQICAWQTRPLAEVVCVGDSISSTKHLLRRSNVEIVPHNAPVQGEVDVSTCSL